MYRQNSGQNPFDFLKKIRGIIIFNNKYNPNKLPQTKNRLTNLIVSFLISKLALNHYSLISFLSSPHLILSSLSFSLLSPKGTLKSEFCFSWSSNLQSEFIQFFLKIFNSLSNVKPMQGEQISSEKSFVCAKSMVGPFLA